jgi:hypothetical protein
VTLDLKRLRADASKLQNERSKSRSSRETTGTTRAIRAALPEIYKLREDGVQWSVIAASLAAQGIVQGQDRTPLATNRLTALVRQIELQNEKRAAKRAKKGVVTRAEKVAMQNPHLSLSPELGQKTRAVGGRPPQSEDEIRRLAWASAHSGTVVRVGFRERRSGKVFSPFELREAIPRRSGACCYGFLGFLPRRLARTQLALPAPKTI